MADLPDDPFERGIFLERRNDPKGARAAYIAVIGQSPNRVEALASLAWIDGQAGDRASARAWGEEALAIDATNILARMALASTDLQDKRLDAAAERLASLYADPALTPFNRAIVLSLIGDLKDAEGDVPRAFKAYEAANAQLSALYRQSSPTPVEHAVRIRAWFGGADAAPWRKAVTTARDADSPSAHVLLVGFPRSGTTLLETALAGHPDVVTIEEKDALAEAAGRYVSTDSGLAQLAAIDADDAARARDTYWSAVRGFGVEPAGRVFIDKMPLATVLLPLIAKLFPEAKILFALRDPRDVVLSCFRRRFGLNAAMAQFLTLEGAAAYYDAVMALADTYRRKVSLNLIDVRHESLVDDFEDTARSLCDFIGLDWTSDMADIAATARKRSISTPSAAQLAGGLNRDGQGAWRRYAEQMAPVLPLLDPWVERFGYDPT